MTPKPVRDLTTGYLLVNSHRCSPDALQTLFGVYFSVHVCFSCFWFLSSWHSYKNANIGFVGPMVNQRVIRSWSRRNGGPTLL